MKRTLLNACLVLVVLACQVVVAQQGWVYAELVIERSRVSSIMTLSLPGAEEAFYTSEDGIAAAIRWLVGSEVPPQGLVGLLNAMGELGWELIAVTDRPRVGTSDFATAVTRYYFKQPAPNL